MKNLKTFESFDTFLSVNEVKDFLSLLIDDEFEELDSEESFDDKLSDIRDSNLYRFRKKFNSKIIGGFYSIFVTDDSFKKYTDKPFARIKIFSSGDLENKIKESSIIFEKQLKDYGYDVSFKWWWDRIPKGNHYSKEKNKEFFFLTVIIK